MKLLRFLTATAAVSLLLLSGWLLAAAPAPPGKLTILLPLGRTAYQTNEWIDVSVVREGKLDKGDLLLTLSSADGSKLSATFAVEASEGRRTEHLHVNGWLLRPGKYTVEASCDG